MFKVDFLAIIPQKMAWQNFELCKGNPPSPNLSQRDIYSRFYQNKTLFYQFKTNKMILLFLPVICKHEVSNFICFIHYCIPSTSNIVAAQKTQWRLNKWVNSIFLYFPILVSGDALPSWRCKTHTWQPWFLCLIFFFFCHFHKWFKSFINVNLCLSLSI